MNQKVVIPEHIDPRETVKKVPSAEVISMSNMMKASGNTPYRYVRAAFKKLSQGDSEQAMYWLDRAQEFEGVFYTGKQNEVYKAEIVMLRITMLFLIEKFQDLKPEE